MVQLKNPSHELGIELPVNDGYVKTRYFPQGKGRWQVSGVKAGHNKVFFVNDNNDNIDNNTIISIHQIRFAPAAFNHIY